MEKLEVIDEAWDVKKILAAVFIIGLIVFTLKTYVLDKNLQNENLQVDTKVEGAAVKSDKTEEIPSQNLRKDLDQKLNDLKENVNNINVIEVATSTPAVQKVLNDIKNLQDYPKDQCLNICNNLCIR